MTNGCGVVGKKKQKEKEKTGVEEICGVRARL
jgi:hypothetical protein